MHFKLKKPKPTEKIDIIDRNRSSQAYLVDFQSAKNQQNLTEPTKLQPYLRGSYHYGLTHLYSYKIACKHIAISLMAIPLVGPVIV